MTMKPSTKAKMQAKPLKDFMSVRAKPPRQGKVNGTATTLKNRASVDDTIALRLARAAGMDRVSKSVSRASTTAADHPKTPQKSTLVVSSPTRSGKNRTVAGNASVSKRTFVDDLEVRSEKIVTKATNRSLFARSTSDPELGTEDPIAAALAAADERNKTKVGSTSREKYGHLLAGNRITPVPAPHEVGPSGIVDETKSRYRYLVDKDRRTLRLPFKYQILLAKFLALETVCMIQQHCRGRTVTFDSARPSVERTCSKEFTMDDLARIKTVFPSAYEFTVIHRNGKSPDGQRGTIGGYHQGQSTLRIVADFGNDLEIDRLMAERKEAFTVSLMDICAAAHKHFLSLLPIPMACEDGEMTETTIFHPDFVLDNVPDIKLAPLPEPRRVRVPSAADILKTNFDLSTSVTRALEHVVAKQSIPASPQKKRSISPDQARGEPAAEPVQTAPLTLRDRIRLKERLNKEEKMREEAAAAEGGTKNAQAQWECACILRSYGITRRRTAFPLSDALAAVRRSVKSPMSDVALRETLFELTDVVPAWCVIKKVLKKNYFSMNPVEFPDTQKYFSTRIKK